MFICDYESTEILCVENRRCAGIVLLGVKIGLVAYIVGKLLLNEKCKEFGDVESAVTTKLEGVIYTNNTNDQFNEEIVNPELYRRTWDIADYVISPTENGVVFVGTNVVITSNQEQGTCGEDPDIYGAQCDPDNNKCIAGSSLPAGNGIMTGECISVNKSNQHVCEIEAWCPVETDVTPLKNNSVLLVESQNFILFVENYVYFPKFEDSNRHNIRDRGNETYLTSCHYDRYNAADCPVFVLGDIVRDIGEDFEEIADKGGTIAMNIEWHCDLDHDEGRCLPSYSFSRLDEAHSPFAPGWNFRYGIRFNDTLRTLYKIYGINFVFVVSGEGKKFSAVPCILAIGATVSLCSLVIMTCQWVTLYFMKRKDIIEAAKYEVIPLSNEECRRLCISGQKRDVPLLEGQNREDASLLEGERRYLPLSEEENREDASLLEGENRLVPLLERQNRGYVPLLEGQNRGDASLLEGEYRVLSLEGQNREDVPLLEGQKREDVPLLEGQNREDVHLFEGGNVQ